MPRILFSLDFYDPHIGGAERLFQSIAEDLARCGWHVDVVTQRLRGTPKRERLNGVNIRRVRAFGSRVLFFLAAIPVLIRHARRATLIHTSPTAAALAAIVAARFTKTPTVVTIHEVWGANWPRFSDKSAWKVCLLQRLESFLLHRPVTQFVTVSMATENALRNFLGEQTTAIQTISNGIDYAQWTPVAPTAPSHSSYTFFYSGRPDRVKGLSVLLNAFARVTDAYPAAQLHIVLHATNHSDRAVNRLHAWISSRHLENRICLDDPMPQADDLRAAISRADCVVIPSLSEGFCLAAAEASALQKNILATRIPALQDVVSGNCIFVPPNDETALADALANAMQGAFQRLPERRFPIETTCRQYRKLYQRLVKRN